MANDLSARKLLLEVRNDFNSCVDPDSLIEVLERHKMLRKKDKKFLGRPEADDNTKNTLLFHKMYNSEATSSPLSAAGVIQLLEETKNERNILFSKTLLSILLTITKTTMPPLPPFNCPLDDHPSAIFSSAGGVLYSPVYGVTVYIPAGAILGEKQVEVSFRLVTEEAKVREFLSSPLLEGSVLCSGVVEFEAKFVDAPDGVKFDKFQSDVWIELPHCLSFRGCSPKDYSTAFVMSDSRGEVEMEVQALFAKGYPYVNLPVRHFSKFRVVHSPKKHFAPALHAKKALPKLNVSRSLEKYPANDSTTEQVKKAAQTSAASPSADEKRKLNFEMKKASNEASTEEKRQALIRQDASANLSEQDAMEVYPPAPAGTAYNTSLQQEDLNVQSSNVPKMSVMACTYEPRGRSRLKQWSARIVFAPHLHNTYQALANFQEHARYDCCSIVFNLELRTKLIQLKSGPSTPGWNVKLSVTQILLEHFQKVTPWLRNDSKLSSKMANFLPASLAAVQNCGALLPLRHPIEVERSDPLTHCHLTCEPVMGEGESAGVHIEAGHNTCSLAAHPTPSGSPQDPSSSCSTPVYRLHICTRGTSLSDSAQGTSPSDSTRGTSPPDSTQGTSPPDSTRGTSPSNSTQGTSPPDSTQGTSPSNSTQGTSPPDSTQGTSPPDSTQGTSPSNSAQGTSPPDSTATRPTSAYPSAPSQDPTIQWERDRYVLALLSIMVPEDLLVALGKDLGLSSLVMDQVMSSCSAGNALKIGERAYEMFRRASTRIEQPLTFGKILRSLHEIDRSDELVPILRSYVLSFKMATPVEENGSISKCFFVWLRENHPELIDLCGTQDDRIISQDNSFRSGLFRDLSPKLVCVWRMVGRLLGLSDSAISEIDIAHGSEQHRVNESCYQMLLKWADSLDQSDITYYRLMAAFQVTSRGTGAANDVIFYLHSFTVNLASVQN